MWTLGATSATAPPKRKRNRVNGPGDASQSARRINSPQPILKKAHDTHAVMWVVPLGFVPRPTKMATSDAIPKTAAHALHAKPAPRNLGCPASLRRRARLPSRVGGVVGLAAAAQSRAAAVERPRGPRGDGRRADDVHLEGAVEFGRRPAASVAASPTSLAPFKSTPGNKHPRMTARALRSCMSMEIVGKSLLKLSHSRLYLPSQEISAPPMRPLPQRQTASHRTAATIMLVGRARAVRGRVRRAAAATRASFRGLERGAAFLRSVGRHRTATHADRS